MDFTPDEHELADLELLLSGAFHPLTGFLGHDDVHTVQEQGTLADGTPWPAPVTLHLPAEAVPGDEVRLLDPEGLPLAVVTVTPDGPNGPLRSLNAPEHGPFARLRRTPEQVRAELAGAETLAVTMRGPLDDLSEVAATAKELDARILLLPCRTAKRAQPW